MRSQPNPSSKLCFGPFEFEQLSGDLRKFGNRIRLQGKPLQILSLLLEQPGHILSRDELQRQLWQGTTFVDLEQGLNTAVNKLRQALGDSADQPRYIETVPGKGYRFIAPVHGPPGKAVLEMAPPVPLRVESRPQQRKPWAALIAVAASLGLGGGAFWFATTRADAPAAARPARFTVVPPSGFVLQSGTHQTFALSPDGTHLAFTAMDTSGASRAFVRDFNSIEPRRLPGSEGVHTLFWAPDSRSVFLTLRGKVVRMPLDGDARVDLGDSPGVIFSGAWLNPERLLLAGSLKTYWISTSGGHAEALEQVYSWPQVLPDGNHILYVSGDPQNNGYRARTARLNDPGSARDLLHSDSRVVYVASLATRGAGYVMYLRSGNLLAQPFDSGLLRPTGEPLPVMSKVSSFRPTGAASFAASSSGAIAYQPLVSRSQLVWVDREGRQVGSVGPGDINVKAGRLSPDGRKVVTPIYDVERGAQNLWVVDVGSNAARELTLEPGVRDAPVWSPDSKKIAFLHGSVGRQPQVRIRGLGENDAEEALAPDQFQIPTDWSPDGRFLVFSNTAASRVANETHSDVLLFDLAQGRRVIPVLSTRFHEANGAFSPDGKWLTFTSNESGRAEVYVQAFESTGTPRVTGERYPVTRSGAQALRWRRDGKELYYLAFDGRVYAVSANLSSKPEFGRATPLFSISTEVRAAIHSLLNFDVSPDGQRFLIPAMSSPEGPVLVVMQNWEAALARNRSKTAP